MLLANYAGVIKKHLPLEGFELSPGKRGTVYSKEDDEWRYFISFDNILGAGQVRAGCSGGDLAHKATETIFKKLSDKYPSLPRVTSTFSGYNQYQLTDTRETIVNSEEELVPVVEIWKREIYSMVLPFFDGWADLGRIDKEIVGKVSWKEMHRYIPGATVQKVLIIMKLTGDPSYERFMKERQDALKQAIADGKTQYQKDLVILEDLAMLLG